LEVLYIPEGWWLLSLSVGETVVVHQQQQHARHGGHLYTVANAAVHLSRAKILAQKSSVQGDVQVPDSLIRVVKGAAKRYPKSPLAQWLMLELELRIGEKTAAELEKLELAGMYALCDGSGSLRDKCLRKGVRGALPLVRRLLENLKVGSHEMDGALIYLQAYAEHKLKHVDGPQRGFFHVNGLREDEFQRRHSHATQDPNFAAKTGQAHEPGLRRDLADAEAHAGAVQAAIEAGAILAQT